MAGEQDGESGPDDGDASADPVAPRPPDRPLWAGPPPIPGSPPVPPFTPAPQNSPPAPTPDPYQRQAGQHGPQQYAPQPQAALPNVAMPPGWYPAPWGGTGWWDGGAWAPPVERYVEPYAPVHLLARVTQVLLAGVAAVYAVAIVVDVGRYRDAQDIDLATSLEGIFTRGNASAAGVSALTTFAVVATAAVFLVWRYRIQKNLIGALGVSGTEFTPGWAVGWFFIPIANLWKAKQAMDEAWLASDPLQAPGTRGWLGRRAAPLLTWWWGTWILSFVVRMNIQIGRVDYSVSASEIRFGLVREMLGFGLSIVAACLCIQVVGEITSRHRSRATVLGIPDA